MTEPRPVPSGNGTIDSVVHLVRELKFGGLPAVAWTFIVCSALWKQDGATLKWLWPELFLVWKVLVGGWAGYTALVSSVAWFRKRRELVPVIAHAPPRIAPAADRAANG